MCYFCVLLFVRSLVSFERFFEETGIGAAYILRGAGFKFRMWAWFGVWLVLTCG